MEEKNEELLISPKVIWEIVRKNIVFILVTVIVFSLGSFFVTKFFIPKKYTAKVSLYVDTSMSEDGQYNPAYSLNMQTYAQRLVSTYIRMLDTTSFYNEVAEYMNDQYTSAQLSKMISFQSDETTEIFDVIVRSNSPDEALGIGNAVAEVAPKTISNLKSNAKLKVCDPARLPTAPSSPNTTRNVVLAFIAGLILSLAVVFIRHVADKKIKYNEEMTEISGIPILAAVPNFDNYINQKKKNET
ncbi:MAG: hypothetical protein IJH96_01540 [Ruminococcus sp.]|nr:hypothetical protein [Ruminococcus sp.]